MGTQYPGSRRPSVFHHVQEYPVGLKAGAKHTMRRGKRDAFLL
jgi:hypothetical protein